MSEWEVYWWLKLDAINTALGVGAFIGGFLVVPLCGIFMAGFKSRWRFLILLSIIPELLMISGSILVPTTKEYAVIKVLPKIVNSDFAEEAVGDARMIYDVAKNYLKETLKVEAPDAKG